MNGYRKITKNNQPKDGAIVNLYDGEREITAKWHNDNGVMGFTWIPKHFQNGICLMTKPTHWK